MPATYANRDEKQALRCWALKRVLKTGVQTSILIREMTPQLEEVTALPGHQVWFPASTCQPTTICSSSSKGSNVFFSLGTVHTWWTYMHAVKTKINKSL